MIENLNLPKDAILVEIAPGFKTKIGRALADYGFRGILHIVEANSHAGAQVIQRYKKLLPHARVIIHTKPMREAVNDLPNKVDLIMANHVLDDMVLYESLPRETSDKFFALNSGSERINLTKKFWNNIPAPVLSQAKNTTISNWMYVISHIKSRAVILSQYKSQTLQQHKIYQPDKIGEDLLGSLKKYYNIDTHEPFASYLRRNGQDSYWFIKLNLYRNLLTEIEKTPEALKRLAPDMFVEEKARKLRPEEYSVVYTNNSLLKGLGYIKNENQIEIDKIIGDAFAYKIKERQFQAHGRCKYKTVYADKQCDPTDIALAGNKGSGRSCYIGSEFNIKGIGKTQLIGNPKDPLHKTGTLDIVTALREALMSDFLCKNTDKGTSPVIAVIALKNKFKMPWDDRPVATALLVRLDRKTLDRPSHLACKKLYRDVNLKELIQQYALLETEMFAHRILHGAWSIGNVSLDGHILDIESVSVVSGYGPKCNVTKKYLSNYFGYEHLGFKQIVEQLAKMLGVNNEECQIIFDETRKTYLTNAFLYLLGISHDKIDKIKILFPESIRLATQFETLSKKIGSRKINLCVFGNKERGVYLLDLSKLFRNLASMTNNQSSEKYFIEKALQSVLRKKELRYSLKGVRYIPENLAEKQLKENAVIEKQQVKSFLQETQMFIRDLLRFMRVLRRKNHLPPFKKWKMRIKTVNKEILNYATLTDSIKQSVGAFDKNNISNQELNQQIHKLQRRLKKI